MVGDSLGNCDHAEMAADRRNDDRSGVVRVMTLTPKQIRLILSCMGEGESAIRPGSFTALDRLALVEELKRCAAMEDEDD